MTLAEAVEPLYRAYLRRLDEMAARLPDAARLTEATTRRDDGTLAVGDDGLPLRFDVADARTGETFDVHGSAPDAPASPGVRVAGLEVQLVAGHWEDLAVACAFAGDPDAPDAESLAMLLASFGEVASAGAFATDEPRWRGRLHAVRSVELRGQELVARYDFGTCPPAGLHALVRAVAGWSEDRVRLAGVRIGG